MINMIDAVKNALRSDAAIATAVSTRVYWLQCPNKVYPYITLFEVSNDESESADDSEYSNDIEIQVDIWSKGTTIQIASDVQRVMRGLGFIHQAMPDQYEEDTQIYHKPIRFMITKEL